MILEIRSVSRKTPGDGKFEIGEETASRLRAFTSPLHVRVDDVVAPGTVTTLHCTCAKGNGAGHAHHFLQSDAMRRLTPDETVVLELTAEGEIAVARPHPLLPEE